MRKTASSGPRRGVGRFVADTLPRIGTERIRPLEEILGGPGQHLEIKRVLRERQPASEFVAPGAGVQPGADCWLWESVLIRDGEAIAHLQENNSALPDQTQVLSRSFWADKVLCPCQKGIIWTITRGASA